MSTAERQKVADGLLAALLESATTILATMDGGGDRGEKPPRRPPMVRDPAFRARMREQRRARGGR